MSDRESEVTKRCLTESPYMEKLINACDSEECNYVSGLLILRGLDDFDESYDPLYVIHDILTEAGQMSEREAIVLIDNAINSVLDGIVKSAGGVDEDSPSE